MTESSGDVDLAGKAIGADGHGDFGEQHLDGHIAVVAFIMCEVDCGHAAASELAQDAIALFQHHVLHATASATHAS